MMHAIGTDNLMPTIGQIRSDQAAHAYNTNPPSDLHRLIVLTGEWLEKLTGEPGAANAAMIQLHDALGAGADAPFASDRNWRQEWESDAHDSGQLMVRAQNLTSLMAFAGFGIDPDTSAGRADLASAIEAKIAAFREFLDLVPAAWGDMNELRQVTLAAEGRIALDLGRPISPEQLAALAGIGLRAVQNLLAKKGGSTLHADPEGRIAAEVALEWLSERPEFLKSVWMDPDREADAVEAPEPVEAEAPAGGYLFVPVAADGSAFTPDLWRGGGYMIGHKGAERPVDDYRTALEELASMPRPAWRRPNPKGAWGIVSAKDWRRQSARSLGLEP